jgi:hypothetical protein
MVKLAPKEAAAQIRGDIDTTTIKPENIHQVNFVTEVVKELGLPPSPEAFQHVADVLHHHDIEIPRGDEYPKYLGKDKHGHDVIARNEDEEAQFTEDLENGEVPGSRAPVPPPPLAASDRPPYEPGAKEFEPGGENRPTHPAPEASPVSDSTIERNPRKQLPQDNPNATPNPQPKVSEQEYKDSVKPENTNGQTSRHQERDPADGSNKPV